MKKQEKRVAIKYDLNWEYGIEISKLRKDLDEIEKLGANYVDIKAHVFYDCAELTIEPICIRMETDEELKNRIGRIKINEAQVKEQELRQLRALELKYKT